MSDDKCPFCGEPSIARSSTKAKFRRGTRGPDENGEYSTGHTCDIATYNRLLADRDAEIERLRELVATRQDEDVNVANQFRIPGENET